MGERKYFIFKEKDTNDRDCVNYIESYGFHCGHYFGGGNLTGACFCGGGLSKINYDNIDTILTKADFDFLIKKDKELNELGYGIKKGDEKYQKGMKIINEIKERIFNKLQSEENQKLFEEIIEQEKEYCMNEFGITDYIVDEIFEEYNERFGYSLPYQDRAIICRIFDDYTEIGEEMAENTDLGLTDYTEQFFDFGAFGESIAEGENYYELSNGKIVEFAL